MNTPKYDYDDVVKFKIGDEIVEGKVYIIDRYGTFEQNEEPSYDIYVKSNGEGVDLLYKHIRESWIIN